MTYAGLSRVLYTGEPFDLGYGLQIRPTFAHIFASPMMAFQPAPEGGHHPPPWKPVMGGQFAEDITVELVVPQGGRFPGSLGSDRVVRLIASLLRLHQVQLSVPVLSDHPFAEQATFDGQPRLIPFEAQQRNIKASPEIATIDAETLEWLRDHWPHAATLVTAHPAFDAALDAADQCVANLRTSSALLLAWGALEGLFGSRGGGEISYRVSANIASWLYPFGEKRLETFRKVRKLYDARSAAAHSAKEAKGQDLWSTYILLRDCLRRMVTRNFVPEKAWFEESIFGYEIDDNDQNDEGDDDD